MESKILLVLSREYSSRVKKKSFILMTILAPILFAGFFVFVGWMSAKKDTTEKTIAVIDDTNLFQSSLTDTDILKYEFIKDKSVDDIKSTFEKDNYYAVLYISKSVTDGSNGVIMYSTKKTSLSVQSSIERVIEKRLFNDKLNAQGIDRNLIEAAKTNINIRTIEWGEEGQEKESSSEVATALAFGCGFLIFMFVLMYGVMVMRGIIEEKSSRIVEVIVSSVKPFQLMMGKIIGIALVGLTQFAIWIALTLILVVGAKAIFMPELKMNPDQAVVTQNIMEHNSQMSADATTMMASTNNMGEMQQILESLYNINWGLIAFAFFFFFIGGYLLYAAIFAIVGAAVDNETDTQQFMFPIMIPLYVGFYAMFNVVQNPDTAMADWFSIIPFTSPIVMLGRIPFGVPVWQLILSMVLLVITFIGATWFAGRIYRTGILMYGKKPSYKELWKWFKY